MNPKGNQGIKLSNSMDKRNPFDLTIILIEHDMSLVMNICERIFVFDYGHLVASGTPLGNTEK